MTTLARFRRRASRTTFRMRRRARRAAVRIRSFYERWGALIQMAYGALMAGLTIAVLVLAWQVWGQTRLAARACERSREFGPYIARDYNRRGVMPPVVQARYEASIPRRCDD
jgi:hypothetical protein